MAETKLTNNIRIESDGLITKIFIDNEEVKDIKAYSLSADAATRETVLHLDIHVDKLNVEVLNAIIKKQAQPQ